MSEKITLSAADMHAVASRDADYINNKGANLYVSGNYAPSLEYYRLASAMGDVHATSNLGYCYLYGRSIEPNLSLAIAYFYIAAREGDVDAAYKLGDIYGSDKWGVKDPELSVYYYQMAANQIIGDTWDGSELAWKTQLQIYPSLCFALGREMSRDGMMYTDIDAAYQFLKHAEAGYQTELANGSTMYQQSYERVLQWLADPQFDTIREKYDALFAEEG